MKNKFYSAGTEKEREDAPTVTPTTAPPSTSPDTGGDPSRIPFKRPAVDPRPKA